MRNGSDFGTSFECETIRKKHISTPLSVEKKIVAKSQLCL